MTKMSSGSALAGTRARQVAPPTLSRRMIAIAPIPASMRSIAITAYSDASPRLSPSLRQTPQAVRQSPVVFNNKPGDDFLR